MYVAMVGTYKLLTANMAAVIREIRKECGLDVKTRPECCLKHHAGSVYAGFNVLNTKSFTVYMLYYLLCV